MREGDILKKNIKIDGRTIPEIAELVECSRAQIFELYKKDVIPEPYRSRLIKYKLLDESPKSTYDKTISYKILKTERGKDVPYLGDVDVFAGKKNVALEHLDQYITDYISVPLFKDADAYVNVHGHSMYPKYASGQIIAIKRVQQFDEVQYGQVYVVVTEENRVLKFVRRGEKDEVKGQMWRLVSENPKFDDMEIPVSRVTSLWLVLGKLEKDVL